MARVTSKRRVTRTRSKAAAVRTLRQTLKRVRATVEASPQETVYVAVVVRKDSHWLSSLILSMRDSRDGVSGGWECFLGTDRDQVIKRALTGVRRWGPEKYQVWVGTVSSHVEVPVNFTVVAGL